MPEGTGQTNAVYGSIVGEQWDDDVGFYYDISSIVCAFGGVLPPWQRDEKEKQVNQLQVERLMVDSRAQCCCCPQHYAPECPVLPVNPGKNPEVTTGAQLGFVPSIPPPERATYR